MAADFSEVGEVEHDCATVGQFMTEAAEWCREHGRDCEMIIEGGSYRVEKGKLVRVEDNTPFGTVNYRSGGTTPILFYIATKPRPKTVTRSGWVNLYKGG